MMSTNPFEPTLKSTDIPTQRKRGFRLVEFCVVIVIIGALVGLLLPAVRTSKGAVQRMQCFNNLKQLALAMHNYHAEYKSLPPAYTVDADGNRLHSWRTLLLPYMEERRLYEQIDLSKPWNDPVNIAATSGKVPPVFVCSADTDSKKTLYQVVVDPESCFPGADSVSFDNVTDGTSNTVLIIETPEGRGVDWMSPYDADWPLLIAVSEKSQLVHEQIFHGALVDGSIHAFSKAMTLSGKRSLVTIAADDVADFE